MKKIILSTMVCLMLFLANGVHALPPAPIEDAGDDYSGLNENWVVSTGKILTIYYENDLNSSATFELFVKPYYGSYFDIYSDEDYLENAFVVKPYDNDFNMYSQFHGLSIDGVYFSPNKYYSVSLGFLEGYEVAQGETGVVLDVGIADGIMYINENVSEFAQSESSLYDYSSLYELFSLESNVTSGSFADGTPIYDYWVYQNFDTFSSFELVAMESNGSYSLNNKYFVLSKNDIEPYVTFTEINDLGSYYIDFEYTNYSDLSSNYHSDYEGFLLFEHF